MGIDILVPVLGRPHNVQPLLDSLKTTREPYTVLFLCSPLDILQIEACRASGHRTAVMEWEPGKADFAKKINWAFDRSGSEWLFQGADDIRFKDGWDREALKIAGKFSKRVIGTNDLHNPSVKRKMSSTHTLFARSYITEHGGTLDDTGRVFCELYDHQFVDTEFCEVARRRKEWAFSRASVVEHLHPHWGLAPSDDTYKKAMRHTGRDYRLYMTRMGHHLPSTRQSRQEERNEKMRLRRLERQSRR